MRTIVAPSTAAAEWVAKRVDSMDAEDIGPNVSFGVVRDGKPVAGVVFHWYRRLKRGADMSVIIAATDARWCTRPVLRALFTYAFETARVTRLTCIIREGNERSIKLCAGLGFTKEGVIRRGYDGKSNALVYGMLRSQCKWI